MAGSRFKRFFLASTIRQAGSNLLTWRRHCQREVKRFGPAFRRVFGRSKDWGLLSAMFLEGRRTEACLPPCFWQLGRAPVFRKRGQGKEKGKQGIILYYIMAPFIGGLKILYARIERVHTNRKPVHEENESAQPAGIPADCALFFQSNLLRRERDSFRTCSRDLMGATPRVRIAFAKQPVAERTGFEPVIPFGGIHAFQACLFNHSSTSPDGV